MKPHLFFLVVYALAAIVAIHTDDHTTRAVFGNIYAACAIIFGICEWREPWVTRFIHRNNEDDEP